MNATGLIFLGLAVAAGAFLIGRGYQAIKDMVRMRRNALGDKPKRRR